MLRVVPSFLVFSAAALAGCGPPFLEFTAADQGTVFEIQPEDEVSFGHVSPYGSPITEEAMLQSWGSGTVVIEQISLEQDARTGFTLVSDPTPLLLTGDDEMSVEFRFHSDEAGQYSGRVTFLAKVNGADVEMSRRLTGAGCSDLDGDGECVGAALPGWDPVGPEDTGVW